MSDDDPIHISITRLGSEGGEFVATVSQEADFLFVKQQILQKWNIPVDEQHLVFRGKPVQEEDVYQPFIMPEIQDLMAERGRDSLKISVLRRPNQTAEFLKKEGMLAKGVPDLNMKTKHGASALHKAVRSCHTMVVQDLLRTRRFVLVDSVDSQEQTSLHTAVQCRIREMCELLLVDQPRFTEVGAQDARGQTALHLVALWGDEKVAGWILRHSNFTEHHARLQDEEGYTALQYATQCGNESVRALIHDVAPQLTNVFAEGLTIEAEQSCGHQDSEKPMVWQEQDVAAAADSPTSKMNKEDREPAVLPQLNWAALSFGALNRSPAAAVNAHSADRCQAKPMQNKETELLAGLDVPDAGVEEHA